MELKLKNVSKDYGSVLAVDNVNYSMETGVYGLLGVNGAGKTTLMTMLCTVTCPSAGGITWDGDDIFELEEDYRGLLGYLPQDFGYYPDLSVFDYLMYIAALKGIPPAAAKKRIRELLDMVGLLKYRKRKMKALSGGMVRRAGIAQAMLNDPKILILDEPTAGLDPNERIRFRNLISELSENRLVLLSTHIVSDIEYIANQIWLMKDGALVHRGTLDETIASMPETVWKCAAEHSMVPAITKKYKVSNLKSEDGHVELRIISPKRPAPDAEPVRPALEDVFLYYFGETMDDEPDMDSPSGGPNRTLFFR